MATEQKTFVPIQAGDPIFRIASPLVVTVNGRAELASGTAFAIGSGFALTAYHVIDDFLRRYGSSAGTDGKLNIPFEMRMFVSLGDSADFVPLTVASVWRAIPIDIAVLHLAVPTDFHDRIASSLVRMQLGPPQVGDRIFAAGFPGPELLDAVEDKPQTLTLNPHTSIGTVVNVHRIRRDAVMLPFPCFQTSARFDHSMSGGPVFNESGSLCGVIASEFDLGESRGERLSYVSSLWPIVSTIIDAPRAGIPSGQKYPLFDLFRAGLLSATDFGQVSLVEGENGAAKVAFTRKKCQEQK
jgi:S1-C subfamily serine protease